MILLPLRFYVKSNFGEFKWSKNAIFGSFRDSDFEFMVNLDLESCSNWIKSKFRTSEIVKNDFFAPVDLAKIWFHMKSEWQ